MILFQCAHGDCRELAELARNHHAWMLPQAHVVIETELHENYRAGMHGGWNKLHWLLALMESCVEGEEILCLDADAVIVRSFAFIDALPYEYDFAAVKNQKGSYNTGAMFWRNSPSAREIIKRALSVGPIGGGHEQKTLNMLLNGLRCRQLPREWNDYQWAMGAPTSATIIRAWHGEPRDNADRGIRKEISRAA